MMNKNIQGILVATCIALTGLKVQAEPLACEQLTAVVMQQSPYVAADEDTIEGPYAIFLERTLNTLGIELKWLTVKSDQQAEKEVAAGRADLLLAVPISQERLMAYDYIHPQLVSDDWRVWGRTDELKYSGWNDLRGLRGASADLKDVQLSFQKFAKRNLELLNYSALNAFAALSDGKLDYVIYPKAFAQTLKLDDAMLTDFALDLDVTPLYLALSHQSACNTAWLRGTLAQQMLKQQSIETLLLDEATDEN